MKEGRGQTLIEVVVSIAIIILIIFGLLRITTISIKDTSFAKNQSLATKYAQEGIEKVRAYKNQEGWQRFTANCETILDSLSLPSPFQLELDCHLPDSSEECREESDSCEVLVVVSWQDSHGTHQASLTTRLTNWR